MDGGGANPQCMPRVQAGEMQTANSEGHLKRSPAEFDEVTRRNRVISVFEDDEVVCQCCYDSHTGICAPNLTRNLFIGAFLLCFLLFSMSIVHCASCHYLEGIHKAQFVNGTVNHPTTETQTSVNVAHQEESFSVMTTDEASFEACDIITFERGCIDQALQDTASSTELNLEIETEIVQTTAPAAVDSDESVAL